ncbi:dienelactone hydrolase family protein, partial [Streptomyces sp. DT17]
MALRPATASADLVAAVAGFHAGFLMTAAPDSPHRLISELTAEDHLGLAENDLTPEASSELNQAHDAAGVVHPT